MSPRLVFWMLVVLGFVLVFAVLFALLDFLLWLGLRAFLSPRALRTIFCVVDAGLLLWLVGAVLVGHYHTRLQVEVARVEVRSPRLPHSFDGLRVAHISDFHIDSFDTISDRPFMDKLADILRSERPDLICFTGDLVTIASPEARPWRDALARLAAQEDVPVFAILGNHDYADYVREADESWRTADRDHLRRMLTAAGWQLLDNRSTLLRRGGDSIAIVGVGNIGEPPFATYGNLDTAMQDVGGRAVADSMFTLLLSHNPVHWRTEIVPQTHIDLTLSGHTHAMQLRLFGWSPSAFRYPEWAGLYREGDQYLYVNTGLGCTGPRVRIGVPPEVTILTLRSEGVQ